MLAKKENRVYRITDLEKNIYLKRGFDIVDEDGNILEPSLDKKIAYSEHLKIVNELKNEIESLKSKKSKTDKVEDKDEKVQE